MGLGESVPEEGLGWPVVRGRVEGADSVGKGMRYYKIGWERIGICVVLIVECRRPEN